MKAWRCPACRTRRATFTSLLQHKLDTGHKACVCGGQPYPHRPGTACCEHNPYAGLQRAIRDGLDDPEVIWDIMLELVWDQPGKKTLDLTN